MRILLLSVNSSTFYYSQVVLPFGLTSLGSFLGDEGYEIKGIEMNSPAHKIKDRYLKVDEQLMDDIVSYAPDIVGMTTYAENMFNVLYWAEEIKKRLPNIKIVVGGNHASYIPREILETCQAVDFVVRFEGELAFKQLCHYVACGDETYSDVKNLVYRMNGQIRENDLHPLIADLGSLPYLNRDIFSIDEDPRNITHADTITARGCPFHCIFCDCNHYWGKRYRTYPIDFVIEDLKYLKKRHPNLKTVRLRDESVSIDKKRCLELCNALVRENLGISLQAHSRLDGLDEDVISALAAAGFTQLFIGLESGSQTVLDRLRKGIKIKEAERIVPLLRRYGISFRCSLILGNPGETMEESIQTLNMVKKLGFTFEEFYFGVGLIVYPGTAISEDFLQKYPEYRWLQPYEFGAGYRQTLDVAGNPLGVYLEQAQYSREELDTVIDETLKDMISAEHEKSYWRLREAMGVLNILKNIYGNAEKITQIAKNLLKAVDSLGSPWGIYGGGKYFHDVIQRSIKEESFENYGGVVLSPRDLFADGLPSVQEVSKFKYLVAAVSSEEARGQAPTFLPVQKEMILDFDGLLRSVKWRNNLQTGSIDVQAMVSDMLVPLPEEISQAACLVVQEEPVELSPVRQFAHNFFHFLGIHDQVVRVVRFLRGRNA